MIYIGYFRPYDLSSNNVQDLANETLTLICTYSLVMFSAFVPDLETKYNCGWYLVTIVIVFIAINLVLILAQAIGRSLKKCRQKCHKRKI